MSVDINEEYQKLQSFKALGKQFAIMIVKKGKNGHDQKYPLDPRSGELMKWKKDPYFLTLDQAFINLKNVRKSNPSKHFEVGALLTNGLIMLDIDNIYNEIVNKDNPDGLLAKLHQLTKNTYCEVSQSGRGVHFFFTGAKTRKEIRNDKYELYDANRWATLTGNTLWATSEIKHLSEQEMSALEQFLWGDPKPERERKSANTKISNAEFTDADIKKLITKAINAKNGDKFSALFNGEAISDDVSSDDMSFALMLAFWTQKNAKMMDAIFRKSKRMRDKWDEIHSVDGQTYGEMTIENAIANTDEVYHENTKDFHVDKSKIKSNQDLIKALKHARAIWDKQHTVDGKTMPITSKTLDVIGILLDIVNFAIIYNEDPKLDRNLYFFDYDRGVYSQDENDLESLVLAVVPEMTNTKSRKNLLDTILKLPTSKIPVAPNFVLTAGRDLIAVGNGVLNLKTKKLIPYSPQFYITSKIDTNYNPNACKEPIYNGWSWSRSLKEISDGDLDKLKLLWQVVKAAICGYSDLRQSVLLIDDGHGKTGKSTFEDALVGVVGKSNTAQLRLAEMSDETKLVDAVDKRLIIGDDNDVHTIISRYDYLNPVISGERIRVRNYYQKSQSTTLHTFVLQSCNGIPPFRHATPAFFNRLKFIKFNHRHNSEKLNDWRVKNDYIKRKELHEWLLWYVVNNVDVGISLINTQENKDLIADAQVENDTVENFIENWLPDINSTVVPVSWLYDYYTTTCVVDSMPSDSILSRKRFAREIMNKDKFAEHWDKKAKRLSENTFLYSDVKRLANLYNSTHGDRNLKTWIPMVTVTEKQDNDNSVTHRTITKEDYLVKVDSYHSYCFVKK